MDYTMLPSWITRHNQIQLEINARKVNIDYNVFTKTAHEKSLLKQAKLKHKKRLANKPQYEINRANFVNELLTHKTPNWGSVIIDLEPIR